MSELTYTTIESNDYGFEFDVPSDTEILFDEDGPAADPTGLVGAQVHTMTLQWEGRTAFVDRVDLGLDFYQIDWLFAQAALTGQDILDLQMMENDSGLGLGRMITTADTRPGTRQVAYFIAAGENGYYVHAADQASNSLADIVAGSFRTTGDMPARGALTPTQTMTFRDVSVEIPASLNTETFEEGETEEPPSVIAFDGEGPGRNSVNLEIFDSTSLEDPFAFAQARVENAGLITRITERSNVSMALDIATPDEYPLTGYAYSDGDLLISLLVPSYRVRPAVWLVMRKAYVDATLRLGGSD